MSSTDKKPAPREWWIETHETLKGKFHPETHSQVWPQVYESKMADTIHVIEQSAYAALEKEYVELRDELENERLKTKFGAENARAWKTELDNLRSRCREAEKEVGELQVEVQNAYKKLSDAIHGS